ncbi:MAG TPA: hypothetical protein VFH45_09515 [Acidimicrobiales bacterium]|nr:hypothetical protein [Acidimicrobiales bacterium]
MAEVGRVTVRRATFDDVDGLLRLYLEDLSAEDRWTRFFSGYRPDRGFVERLVSLSGSGGCVLVAVADDGRIVADAGWSMLPNGNGELWVTVAPDRRGGMGTAMVAALGREATAQGVANLEAAMLRANLPMRTILRHRPSAVVGVDDWDVVRVVVSSYDGRLPGWGPRAGHPRVLIEDRSGQWRSHEDKLPPDAEVLICRGPRTQICPLLRGGECPLVSGADQIVWNLGGEPGGRDVLRAHRGTRQCVAARPL